jgi:hypothetical protein
MAIEGKAQTIEPRILASREIKNFIDLILFWQKIGNRSHHFQHHPARSLWPAVASSLLIKIINDWLHAAGREQVKQPPCRSRAGEKPASPSGLMG